MSATMLSQSRILIVDDHALVRHGLTQLISHEPDLDVCGDAEDASQALLAVEQTAPDLVIVDISLKESNGIDLIKRLRAHHPHIKILVSSMHDESLYAERALHAGALGYITKQQATDTVIDAIRQVLKGEVYLSPAMTSQLLHRLGGHGRDFEENAVARLSDRELEVFEMIGHGLATRQIAERLHLSIKTIETHREHIKEKLNLANGAELARHAVRWVLEEA